MKRAIVAILILGALSGCGVLRDFGADRNNFIVGRK